MDEIELIHEAKEEIKRADHLVYVSLKYTRTVDVIKSIIERLINCHEYIIDALLLKLKTEKKIPAIPPAVTVKCDFIKKYYNDEHLNNYLEFFLLLRKMSKANFSRAKEYRRNVTMSLVSEDQVIEIDIDIITEYYKRTSELMDYVIDTYFKK